MRNRNYIIIATALALTALALPSQAQLLINPVGKAEQGKAEGALGLGFFKADYEADFRGESTEGYIERSFVFGSLAFGVNDVVDLAVGGAFSFKSETEDFGDDDTGFIVGGGLRSRVWQKDASAIHAYGQVSYVDEEYGEEPETAEFFAVEESASGVEILLGALYAYTGDGFMLYGGAEIVPYSDGDFDVRVSGTDIGGFIDESASVDVERADIFSIKLGGQVDVGAAQLQADATLIGEQTFRVSVIKPF